MAASARNSWATSSPPSHECVVEARQDDGLGVLGLDGDPVGPAAALDAEIGCLAEHRVSLSRQVLLDDVVGELVGVAGLLPHVVEQLVVAPVDTADMGPVVERSEEQHD
jgi:hypothetical protein